MGKICKGFSWNKWTFLCLLTGALILGLGSCSNFIDSESKDSIKTKITVANPTFPVAAVEEPEFTEEGVPKNKAIIISFSHSMDPETFMENLNITDSLGNNLKTHFLEPKWSNENKIVKIAANEANLIDLNGKKSMDIYITLSKSFKTPDNITLQTSVEHKYRICDQIDEYAPYLSIVRAEVPGIYLNRSDLIEPLTLIEGEMDLENEEEICRTNHINSKINFYIEGNDYGGGDISAQIKFERIYDSAGNEVFEEGNTFLAELEDVNLSGNYFGNICLDLSDEAYTDGLYKINVSVVDSSNLESEESMTYYIIRDTTLAYNANALMWFETPMFRTSDDTELSEFDRQVPTYESIESFRNRVQFAYVSDDVFYVSKNGTENVYKQLNDEFTYLFAWGNELDSLNEPVQIEGAFAEETEGENTTGNTSKIYTLPQAFTDYCRIHEEEDIFLQATVLDSVGNKNIITTLIPKKIELYNYEILEDAEESETFEELEEFTQPEEIEQTEEIENSKKINKSVKLNYSDLSSEINNFAKLQDRQIQVVYRIFYGKLSQEMTDEDILTMPLIRNTSGPLGEDDFTEPTDSPVFTIDEDSEYLVFIQPIYNTYSLTNGQWCGQTFGPIYKVIVDPTVAAEKTLTVPEFSVSKESAGINSGLFQINVEITNPESDVLYVPCYSTDGENWILYKSESQTNFSFMIANPLKAPMGKDQAWDNDFWADKSYFEAVKDQGNDSYGTVTTKVKILAIKDNESQESAVEELVFTEDDDNIPPVQKTWNTRTHDSMLSFDGHSFKYENLVIEDEGHALKRFTYYYMPYNDAWGSNLLLANTQQIESLPYAASSLDSYTYRDNGAKYSLSPVIPVNGLKDGKYMFFARISDSYGNYNYITLGKAHIGTFKNKLNVQYDSKKQSFISRINLEPGEKFDRNMINVQNWNNNEHSWKNFYGQQNELQNCERIETNDRMTLYNTTKKQIKRFENGSDVTYTQEIIPGAFYRFTVQGFNENTYNEETGQGVNIRYGRPYNNNVNKESIVDFISGETEYDLCTEETVSNTVYYYVPAENEDFKNFSAKFFASTAAPRSNKPYIVNVISSMRDLGKDVDEWERRGKLIKTHYYNPLTDQTNPDYPFNDGTALDDMSSSGETGLVYYVAIVHFADNSTAISNVYKIQLY